MPLTGFETVTCVLVTPAKLLFHGEGVLLFGWKLYSLFFSLYWWVDHQGLGIAAIIFLYILQFLHVSSRLSHWTPLFFLCMGQVAQMLGSGCTNAWVRSLCLTCVWSCHHCSNQHCLNLMSPSKILMPNVKAMSQVIKMCVLIELVKDFEVQHNIYVSCSNSHWVFVL